jgi:phage terminase large subunit GpA-like protein
LQQKWLLARLVFLCHLRGGNVNQDTSNLFNNAGNNGIYWSSTPYSNGTSAYRLNFNGTSNINPSDNNDRQRGYSVRCPYCARSPILELSHFFFKNPDLPKAQSSATIKVSKSIIK